MKRWAAILWAFLCAVILTGCAGVRAPESPGEDAEWRRYLAAVAAARHPEAAKISKDLLPIERDSPRSRWRDGRVLMVTWTKSKHFPQPPYEPGYEFPLAVDTWFTVAPAVGEFCRGYRGRDLDLRLQQRIGLPPDDEADVFVEVWVAPQDIFRPCPDPEISDTECQVRIPLVDPAPAGKEPWPCPPPRSPPRGPCPPASPQLSGQFVTVAPAHLEWMCANWRDSYENADPRDDYPWTALGYTYDWVGGRDHRGESEYVALAGSRVVIDRVVATAEYCGR